MAHDRPGPAADRLLVARLSGIAQRHARWGALDEAEKAAGAVELREVADDRGDLLAEVAGIAMGASESKGPEYEAQAQAVAELCRLAGADEAAIPRWVEVRRERAELARKPPLSGTPGRRPFKARGQSNYGAGLTQRRWGLARLPAAIFSSRPRKG
jgi:hypothetical protein